MTLRRRLALTLLLAAVPPIMIGTALGPRRAPWRGGLPRAALVAAAPVGAQRIGPPITLLQAALCGWILLWILVTTGTIVRRIGRLRASVLRAAHSRYEVPVAVDGGDDEIAALARAFNEAGRGARAHLASLERRDQALRALVSDTTHDVAVPLGALQASLVDLKERLLGDGAAADDLAVALSEVHYLSSLVHNLGASARLAAHAPERSTRPVSLNEVVERVAARHKPLARHLRITLEHAVPEETLEVTGDVTLVEQAVTNVVHNAVRYNRPGGHVAVVLEVRRKGEAFSIRVLDDGPGVSDEDLGRLTERCFRGEGGAERRPEGMGLGLHITARVAACHGFDLVFARSEHGGLEVELSGPCFAPPPRP